MKHLANIIRAVVAECGVLESDVIAACEPAWQPEQGSRARVR